MSVTVHPRCSTDTCVKCRRKLQRGDRVQVVNIIEKIGTNPSNIREVGSWFTGEFEVAHVVCADPGLDNAITLGGTS